MITPPRAAVRRLALGRLISTTGSLAAGTALNYEIYERTGSTVWLTAAMLCTWGLTGFLGPVAGALADRYDRRMVMVGGEIGASACWMAMPLAIDEPAIVLALAFVGSVFLSGYFPAAGAAVPNLAGEDNLSWANSLLSAGNYLGLTLGPLLGGLLVATTDTRWVFIGNAATFVVSAVLTMTVRGRFSEADPTTDALRGEHAGVLAGFGFLRRDRVLRLMALSWIAFIVGMASTLVADAPLAQEFDKGSFGYGLLTAAWGGGTILGTWLGRRLKEDNEGRAMVWCSGLVALTGFGVALSPWFWLVLVWVALFGITDGPTQVAEQNLLQRRTPDVVRSRVMGAWETLMHLALTVALLLGAVLVPILGPRGAYALGGITGVVGTVILVPLLRWLPERRPAERAVAEDPQPPALPVAAMATPLSPLDPS